MPTATYSLHDLSGRKTRDLEKKFGRPMSKWFDESDSEVDMLISILCAITGDPEETFLDMPTDELFGMFTAGEQDPNPSGPPKP